MTWCTVLYRNLEYYSQSLLVECTESMVHSALRIRITLRIHTYRTPKVIVVIFSLFRRIGETLFSLVKFRFF